MDIFRKYNSMKHRLKIYSLMLSYHLGLRNTYIFFFFLRKGKFAIKPWRTQLLCATEQVCLTSKYLSFLLICFLPSWNHSVTLLTRIHLNLSLQRMYNLLLSIFDPESPHITTRQVLTQIILSQVYVKLSKDEL